MARLFHHLTVPEGKLGPVTRRGLMAWIDQIRGTEIETVNAETEEVTADGYRATVAGGGFDNASVEAGYPEWGQYPWGISRGETGWIVNRGRVGIFGGNTRTPEIGGVAISGHYITDPVPTTRPELAYKLTDDVIAVEMHFSITYPSALPPFSVGELPIRPNAAAWLAWPEIKWLSDITLIGGSTPGAAATVTHRRAVPIAAVRGGKAYRLIWDNVLLKHYPTTSHLGTGIGG